MSQKIKVVQMGLGPIGKKTVGFILEKPNLELVGGIDADSTKAGKDFGEITGFSKLSGIAVSKDAKSALNNREVDLVALTTLSSVKAIRSQILELLEYEVNIVSTCEELSYPWLTYPEIAKEIDEVAKKHNVSVLATGVNPGFLMDFLPITMTSVCKDVRSVTIERIQDATPRRIPFQKKIGAGLTLQEFDQKVEEGSLRHVGLTESIHMIASKLGWNLDKTEDIISPIIATKKIKTDNINLIPGDVAGVQQIGRGIVEGEAKITLIFKAAIGELESKDEIIIEGNPDIDYLIKGGLNGDIATCAITVNSIPAVISSRPGLRTMADIETISFY